MHILHVIRTLNPAWGGPVEVVKNLVLSSAGRNITSEVVCIDPPSSEWLTSWAVPVNAVGTGMLGSFGYSAQLDQWLGTNITRFDAVVVHSIWMYFSTAARRAATRHQVRYYVYIHGALDPWFKRRYPVKHLKKVMYWRLWEHKVLRDATAVLFTTEEEKRLATNAFEPYSCNASVVGCGTTVPNNSSLLEHPDRFRAELTEKYPQLNNRHYFLYLGRIHEKKGVNLLLEGFAGTKHLYPEMALVIAGPSAPPLLRRLKTLSDHLGIADQIVWTGPLYGSIKWKALSAADAFVLVSHQENFGMSVAEALGCGTPVLISDKVNIWREVAQANAGLIDADDSDGATRLFERWSKLGGAEQQQARTRARFCFREHLDVSRSCDRLYSLLLEGQSKPVVFADQ